MAKEAKAAACTMTTMTPSEHRKAKAQRNGRKEAGTHRQLHRKAKVRCYVRFLNKNPEYDPCSAKCKGPGFPALIP